MGVIFARGPRDESKAGADPGGKNVNDWRMDGEAAYAHALLEQQMPPHYDEDKHMKVNDLIDSKFLKQTDVPDPVAVTFQSLKKMNMARDDEDPDYRWTAKFSEFAKPMVLNVTNIKRCAKSLGDDTEDWMGKQMELYCDPDIEFGGNIVGGLRLRGIRRSGTHARATAPRGEDDVNRALNAAADDDVPF